METQIEGVMEEARKQDTDADFLHKWRKYMLLLAILVATVTYVAGLNPPGGVDLTGDAVLPSTYPRRYDVFFHCNAMAFMASLVVILLLLDRSVSSSSIGLNALRSAMVLVLLGLLGAYAAGSCQEVVASFYVSVLAAAVSAFIVVHIAVSSLIAILPPGTSMPPPIPKWLEKMENELKTEHKFLQQQRGKFVMLLATFVTSLTYGAGLSPPGGFWPETGGDRHKAGDPMLHESNIRRYRAFFVCNATAFVASVVIITLLLSKRLSDYMKRSKLLAFIVLLQLFGLMGAYAAGSARAVHTTVYVICLVGPVLVFLVLFGIAETGGLNNWLNQFIFVGSKKQQEQRGTDATNRVFPATPHYLKRASPTPHLSQSFSNNSSLLQQTQQLIN